MRVHAPRGLALKWPSRNSSRRFHSLLVLMQVAGLISSAAHSRAETPAEATPPSMLKKLSVEQLMDIEVTSVSKRPEKLSETASAIQVITQEDIRRSGATSIPEALRLA